MAKARYTISTKGSRTVVRRIGGGSYPIVRGTSSGSFEKVDEKAPHGPASARRQKNKRR